MTTQHSLETVDLSGRINIVVLTGDRYRGRASNHRRFTVHRIHNRRAVYRYGWGQL